MVLHDAPQFLPQSQVLSLLVQIVASATHSTEGICCPNGKGISDPEGLKRVSDRQFSAISRSNYAGSRQFTSRRNKVPQATILARRPTAPGFSLVNEEPGFIGNNIHAGPGRENVPDISQGRSGLREIAFDPCDLNGAPELAVDWRADSAGSACLGRGKIGGPA